MGWSIVNLPNMLSWARVIATPLIIWLIFNGDMREAFIVFVLAGVTDALDGFFARRLKLVTDFGRIIDPIADKALLTATYLVLAWVEELPWWLTGLVVGRDILIVAAWAVSSLFGFRISPAPVVMSKINTGFQIGLAALVLLESGFHLSLDQLVPVVIFITAITTVISWLQYLVLWIRTRGTMEKHTEP
ncbi:MAG: CDP-alcohol phosphatidyltransferase family protein [Proteobacteria bacterium]|nr:CDP-alcohol phosphatidyltransferase family protein [Pseudomonadota bacterium]